ncbi:hypothetical protein CABS01_14251 [Colletotrichum abscissum]|uniref:uncharacterized protein n=1 Tax=Colletotrichum abscissum TaxID=1671311 RepID=UPI0027D56474|nr:uncharacterized protein CABS01_14251 [Colletotrichum abscissum]KAK1481163.1 hypothetical protein CABS01_14251 [Colletotrichum abscissum]
MPSRQGRSWGCRSPGGRGGYANQPQHVLVGRRGRAGRYLCYDDSLGQSQGRPRRKENLRSKEARVQSPGRKLDESV